MVVKAPRETNRSRVPPRNIYPNTADITMEPEVAKVFNKASAYLRVAATSRPPKACMRAIATVFTVHPSKI